MNSLIERIFSYILGGAAGFVLGQLGITSGVPMFDRNDEMVISLISSIIGVLVSVTLVEYRSESFLKKNNAIRDETVALITHEMRTSLTSSGWAIGLVLDKYSNVMTEDDKTLLRGVVDSMHATVMHSVNLLDVSLLDIEKLSISLEWTSLEKVEHMFLEMLEKYRLGARGHGIELVCTVSLNHDRMVEVDMLRLRIILENLLENSIQYTKGDRKLITVDIASHDLSMDIKVSDTGIGIPESEQKKIFTEFFRASNARKNLSSGSGIGLYTCSKYVKAHRGTIRFESTEGVGTTFYISIPLKTVADVGEFISSI